MNSSSHIYHVSDIPKEVKEYLNNDFDILSNMLGIESMYETISEESYLNDLDQYPPPKELLNEIISCF